LVFPVACNIVFPLLVDCLQKRQQAKSKAKETNKQKIRLKSRCDPGEGLLPLFCFFSDFFVGKPEP